MIKVVNVHKSYGGGDGVKKTEVLKGVSLEIADGDFVVVLGPSGSGKSTLLNIISGLERPDSGQVIYDGRDISEISDRELTRFRREKVGFIFQHYYLLPNLNVDKNVRMGADLAKNGEYRKVIEAVNLGDKLGKFPYELSGGEQQRVAIARALAKKASVLFLDEPTGALDEKTGRSVLDYIAKLQVKEKFTMVMITHNENIAEMANTVVKVNSGKIVEVLHNKEQKSAHEIGW